MLSALWAWAWDESFFYVVQKLKGEVTRRNGSYKAGGPSSRGKGGYAFVGFVGREDVLNRHGLRERYVTDVFAQVCETTKAAERIMGTDM